MRKVQCHFFYYLLSYNDVFSALYLKKHFKHFLLINIVSGTMGHICGKSMLSLHIFSYAVHLNDKFLI